uniref:Uncharacterized protein n=1 Tax=Meloidogyne enterolobii TaxID=390850 RepID=A0A6V7URM2_MELEN|nr:unnamed protein product [Meloidogyne enterolobii]
MDNVNLYKSILTHSLGDLKGLKNELHFYFIFIYADICENTKKFYKEEMGVKEVNEIKKVVNNIIKNANAFEIEESTGKKLNIKSIQNLILRWKKVLNIQNKNKCKKLFSNYSDNSDISKMRMLFSLYHANLLIKIKNENKQIYEEFLKYLQKTNGAKTRLRQLLFGIEVGATDKKYPLLDFPSYPNEYSDLILLVNIGM